MSLFLDLAVVIIIITFILSARRRGFVSSVIKLAGTLLSFAAALYYSGPLAGWMYDKFFEKKILDAVSKNIESYSIESLESFSAGLESVFEALPNFIGQALRLQSESTIKDWYEAFLHSDTMSIHLSLVNTIISPLVTGLLKAILFCVIFGLLMFFVNKLSHLLRAIKVIPIVGGINSLLGGILGLLHGILVVFVLAAAVWVVVSISGDSLSFITNQIINDSYLFKYFYKAGPWVDEAIRLM